MSRTYHWTAAAAAAALLLAGCTAAGTGTAESSSAGTGGAGTGATDSGAAGGSSASAPASSTGSAAPSGTAGTGGTAPSGGPGAPSSSAAPTAAEWKTFTDTGHRLSFELPKDWTAQQAASPPGSASGALRIEVRDGGGKVLAALQSGISGLGGACPAGTGRPYTVLASVPLDFDTAATDAAAIKPHFVYRVIQGQTHFYGSFGIADHPGGTDGTACMLLNAATVKGMGLTAFGDAVTLAASGDTGGPAAPGGAPKAFSTLAEAQTYLSGSEFANLARMVTSLTFS